MDGIVPQGTVLRLLLQWQCGIKLLVLAVLCLMCMYVLSDRLSCYCCQCDEEPLCYILLHTCVLAPSLDIRFGEIVLPPLPVWAEGSVQCSIVYVHNTLQCNTVQCNAIQCSTMQYSAIQCNTVQYNAIQCNTME